MREIVLFIGPAGSGKTTLVGAFARWLKRRQMVRAGLVNLDPGAEMLPYKPDVDVRKYVRLEDVMLKEGLGPNGALIRSMELLSQHESTLLGELKAMPTPYILVDTPGQMELYLFRDFGLRFTERLKELGAVVVVLVLDPTLSQRPQDLVVLKLLALVVQFRFGVSVIPVINKADLIGENGPGEPETLLSGEALREKLGKETGVLGDLAEQILDVMDNFKLAIRIPLVSAAKGRGLEKLYDVLHEVFCACGDMT